MASETPVARVIRRARSSSVSPWKIIVCLGYPSRAEAPAARMIAPIRLVTGDMKFYHFGRTPRGTQRVVFVGPSPRDQAGCLTRARVVICGSSYLFQTSEAHMSRQK